jgi:hypothetical protein
MSRFGWNRKTMLIVAGVAAAAIVGFVAVGAFAGNRADREWGPFGDRGWHAPGGSGWKHGPGGPGWEHGSAGWGHGPFGPSLEEIRQARARFAADLGAELGASENEVQEALTAVIEKRLDEAVSNDELTRSQADGLLEAYRDGDPRAFFLLLEHDLR